MLNSINNDGPLFSFMTNVDSDRNYVVKWTYATKGKPVLIPIEYIPDSRNIFLRKYAIINANYAVAVYSHKVRNTTTCSQNLLTLWSEIRSRMNYISFQWMAQRNDWIQIFVVGSLSLLPQLDSSQLSSITTYQGLSSDWNWLIQALRPRGKSGVTPNLRLSPSTISVLSKYVCCWRYFSFAHCKNRSCGTRVKTTPASRCTFSMRSQLNLMELHLIFSMVRQPLRP